MARNTDLTTTDSPKPESASTAADQTRWLERVAQAKDREAFASLFSYFAPRVKAYLIRLGADDAQAEEVTQDVMVTVWRKAHQFDASKSSPATWLFRIARNRRIDMLRRRKAITMDTEQLVIEDDTLPDPNAQLDEERRRARILKALDQLPEQQLELVRLAFFTELSHSQIADQTGLPLGTVKSRIRLAFGRLRRILEADDGVDAPDA